jgi:hypothetical protein
MIFQKEILQQNDVPVMNLGSGSPSSNDPKFERGHSGASWLILQNFYDAEMFFIDVL